MYPNIRFVENHFRSYLISKFNYTFSGELVTVRGCKVVSLIQPNHYDYAATAWFLVSGLWPYSCRFKRNVRGSREGNMLIGLTNRFTKKMWKQLGYNFLWRCSTYYLPLLDGTDPRAPALGLVVNFENNISSYMTSYLPEVFPELDFILGRSYSTLRNITKSWITGFTWVTHGARTRTEHITPIRAFGYPSYFQ